MADSENVDPRLYRGECRTCGRTETAGGDMESFERLVDEFADHIDDGSACHEFRIDATYADGVERVI